MSMTYQRLLEQLERYLQIMRRPLTLQSGYCHGLVLLWLYHMLQQREECFYHTLQKIIVANNTELIALENTIEEFLSHLEWLQHSAQYEAAVNQLDFEKLADWHRDGSLSFLLSANEFESILLTALDEETGLCVSGPNHSVGIVKRQSSFYFFDTRLTFLQPRALTDVTAVKQAVLASLFRRDYIPRIKLPIQINRVSLNTANVASNCFTSIYQNLLANNMDLDEPGFQRATNLYLACDSGDRRMVNDLLVNGCDPNQPSIDRWTPLHIAVAGGYQSIVDLLMQYGAVATIKNDQGVTAADLTVAECDDAAPGSALTINTRAV